MPDDDGAVALCWECAHAHADHEVDLAEATMHTCTCPREDVYPARMEERIDLRVPTADLKRWRATAAVQNVSLSEWIRSTCNDAAVDQDIIDAVAKRLAEREETRQRLRAARAAAPVVMLDGTKPKKGK